MDKFHFSDTIRQTLNSHNFKVPKQNNILYTKYKQTIYNFPINIARSQRFENQHRTIHTATRRSPSQQCSNVILTMSIMVNHLGAG